MRSPAPLHTLEEKKVIEYDIALVWPTGLCTLKLFDKITNGFKDGYESTFGFPKDVKEAVVVATSSGFESRDDVAYCRYVYQ